MRSLYSFLFLAFSLPANRVDVVTAFLPPVACWRCSTQLFSGKGIAKDYTWTEEAFEIEVTLQVPKETRAKDIHFKAKQTSIDLRLKKEGEDEDVVLLDPTRKLRGRVVLDGTYWVISDPEDTDDHRQVTVTIEKKIRTPKDDFEVIEYDWNGVYSQDEEEVSYRKYDEPQEMDMREYAASMGVDIDNINMSLVDKTMFSSGLNLTQSSLDSLTRAGMTKEVTQQSDGSEWTTDEEGYKVPFSSMGDSVSKEELQESNAAPRIPFLDTDSPWHKAVPVAETAEFIKSETNVSSEDADKKKAEKKKELQKQREDRAVDPIGTVTVSRLKDILRSRGLKVSGNKKELQDRLRAEVNSMLKDNKNETLSI
jgi:hypothetical protein